MFESVALFDLEKLGDVPFHTEPTINSTQIALPATDRHLILETLISDLKDAENWLPWSNELGTNEKKNQQRFLPRD